MNLNDNNYPVEVYSGLAWQAEMVKDLLQNEGIMAFLGDQITGSLNFPWEGLGTVKVLVSNTDFEKAREVVEAFEKAEEDQEEE
jgi:hypothetical protein